MIKTLARLEHPLQARRQPSGHRPPGRRPVDHRRAERPQHQPRPRRLRAPCGRILASTSELYREEIDNRSRTIQYMAQTPEIVRAAAAGDRAFLFEKLVQIKREFGFDIVNVVNADGTMLVRANNFEAFGDGMTSYRTIQEVLRTHAPVAGTGVLDYREHRPRGAGPGRSGRSSRSFRPRTPGRGSSPVEDRALVIKIAAPIMDGDRLAGILYARRPPQQQRRVHRPVQAARLQGREDQRQGRRDDDDLPRRRPGGHQRPRRLREAGHRDPGLGGGLPEGLRGGRDLGRQGLRRRRLVHLRLHPALRLRPARSWGCSTSAS